MPRTLRDLLYDAHGLHGDLLNAGLYTAAARMDDVIDAIRNRGAYDAPREGTDDDEKV